MICPKCGSDGIHLYTQSIDQNFSVDEDGFLKKDLEMFAAQEATCEECGKVFENDELYTDTDGPSAKLRLHILIGHTDQGAQDGPV